MRKDISTRKLVSLFNFEYIQDKIPLKNERKKPQTKQKSKIKNILSSAESSRHYKFKTFLKSTARKYQRVHVEIILLDAIYKITEDQFEITPKAIYPRCRCN